MVARLLHGLGGRVGDRRPHAAADHDDRTVSLDVRWLAERPHQVKDRIPGLHHVQKLGRLADPLDDDRDGASLGIRVGDRERNPLAMRVQSQDDELAGLPLPGDAGGLDGESFDFGGQKLGLENRSHGGEPRKSSAGDPPRDDHRLLRLAGKFTFAAPGAGIAASGIAVTAVPVR